MVPGDPQALAERCLTTVVILTFGAAAALFVRTREMERLRHQRAQELLETSLTHALAGFIAICAWCKQVRSPVGDWKSIEEYLRGRTERELTHGVCPGCRDRLKSTAARDGA